ncbi:MAG TPA: M35 family metallo-endopeptidase, partial [Polyangiales bacterium]
PRSTAARSLDYLRLHLAGAGKDECSTFLSMAGETAMDDASAVEGATANKVAALKLMRHLYLANLRGGQQLWIASMPRSYRSWPQEELRRGSPTIGALRPKANDVDERFSFDDRKNLGSAAQDALKWSLDAQIKAAPVAAGGVAASPEGAALIRRWFCDEDSDEQEVQRFAKRLDAGFHKIASAANSGRLIFTDHVGYRGTQFEGSEAFVLNGTKRDRPDVVYVESAFFGPNNVLSGRLNWARIVVHELSHRELNTLDVPGHYGWQGIKPSKGSFPAAEAITNAENWAFFAADCAAALTDDKRNEALQ